MEKNKLTDQLFNTGKVEIEKGLILYKNKLNLVSGRLGSGKQGVIKYILQKLQESDKDLHTVIYDLYGGGLNWNSDLYTQVTTIKENRQIAYELRNILDDGYAWKRINEYYKGAKPRIIYVIDGNIDKKDIAKLAVLASSNTSDFCYILCEQHALNAKIEDEEVQDNINRIMIERRNFDTIFINNHVYDLHTSNDNSKAIITLKCRESEMEKVYEDTMHNILLEYIPDLDKVDKCCHKLVEYIDEAGERILTVKQLLKAYRGNNVVTIHNPLYKPTMRIFNNATGWLEGHDRLLDLPVDNWCINDKGDLEIYPLNTLK